MITLSLPWLIVMACALGFYVCGCWIGKIGHNDWGLDIGTFILHVVNFFGWIIVALVGLLLWEVFRR